MLRDEGFRPERVRTIAGASGGAKWLVLGGIDRAILSELAPAFRSPVHLIGSSIGAWRFAAYAQADPLAALDRFEHAYLHQRYSVKPDRREITDRSRAILDALLGANGAAQILSHPVFRTNIMTVRSRGPVGTETRALLGPGLAVAASVNLLNRRLLGVLFDRALFFDARAAASFHGPAGFPLHEIPLTPDNLQQAILASGAIPFVLNGVRDIPGAPPGTYRDGGIIDYHFDLPLSDEGGITLYPHFYGHITPGWFDKQLTWRKPRREHYERVVLVSPSRQFVARLPGGKIPDRSDFVRLDPKERELIWKGVVCESRRLGDELLEAIATGRLIERLEPLDVRSRRH